MQQDKRSSFVWTMRLKRTNILISEQSAQCSGPVDGDPVQNSSTRAELFGLALAMPFLQEFIEFHSISTSSTAYIWSDSAASIARLDFMQNHALTGTV